MTILDDELIEKIEDKNNTDNSISPFVNENSIFYKGLFGMLLCLSPGSVLGLVLVNISLNQSKEVRNRIGRNSIEYNGKRFRKIRFGRTMAFIGLGLFIAEIVTLIVVMSLN